jgi:hypothetical protein
MFTSPQPAEWIVRALPCHSMAFGTRRQTRTATRSHPRWRGRRPRAGRGLPVARVLAACSQSTQDPTPLAGGTKIAPISRGGVLAHRGGFGTFGWTGTGRRTDSEARTTYASAAATPRPDRLSRGQGPER